MLGPVSVHLHHCSSCSSSPALLPSTIHLIPREFWRFYVSRLTLHSIRVFFWLVHHHIRALGIHEECCLKSWICQQGHLVNTIGIDVSLAFPLCWFSDQLLQFCRKFTGKKISTQYHISSLNQLGSYLHYRRCTCSWKEAETSCVLACSAT